MRLSRPIRALSTVLLVCAAPAGCGDAQRVAEGTHADSIVGGTADDDSGTVLLTHLDYGFLCSATVIAPALVVTAKHCVMFPKNGVDTPLPGDRFIVGIGSSFESLTSEIRSTKIDWIGAPGDTSVQAAVDDGTDVALVHLSKPVPKGTTIHSVKFDYRAEVGDPITIVGYGMDGKNGAGSSGRRLAATDEVVGFTPTGIVETQGKGACHGDSGGSFFFGKDRQLVAVTSTAGGSSTSAECDVGITNGDSFMNLAVRKFVFKGLRGAGICSPAPEVCGNGIDDDCDGPVDNHCTLNGDRCASDADCVTSMCREVSGERVCVRPCDATAPCGSKQRCTSSCGGYCVPGARGTRALGESCTEASQCASLACGADESCTLACDGAKGLCPDDQACDTSSGCGRCTRAASVAGKRSLGEPCMSDGDCATAAGCLDDGYGVKRCAEPCREGGCSKGFLCAEGKCVRGGGLPLGERCRTPDECRSGLCADLGGPDDFCTKGCEADADCGDGFTCNDLGGGRYCQPALASLGRSCDGDAACLSGLCSPSLGTCSRKCDPTGAPCPAGFECVESDGDLYCRAAPGAFPAADAGAEDAGSEADAGDAEDGSPTSSQPLPGEDVTPGGGCTTSSRAPGRGEEVLAATAMMLALVARRRAHR